MKANIFKNKTNLASGFTLIELLVVVSIIGMLASVVLVSLQGARNKARDIKLIAEVKQLQNALELYRLDNGKYPGVVAGTGKVYSDTAGCAGATDLLSTVFDQTFRTKYMPTLPTSLTSTCGLFYAVYDNTQNFHSLACAVPPGNADGMIHPDGFNDAGGAGAFNRSTMPNPDVATIANGVGKPIEGYSYVILINTIANPSNVSFPVLAWNAYTANYPIRCILGPKR